MTEIEELPLSEYDINFIKAKVRNYNKKFKITILIFTVVAFITPYAYHKRTGEQMIDIVGGYWLTVIIVMVAFGIILFYAHFSTTYKYLDDLNEKMKVKFISKILSKTKRNKEGKSTISTSNERFNEVEVNNVQFEEIQIGQTIFLEIAPKSSLLINSITVSEQRL